ncbi:MAG TPA: T9SS type A sorting domain-containing protein [Bacteroidia bacterium]
MKIFFTTISLAVVSGIAYCQTPTLDFESWTGTGANIEPTGWLSENAVVLPPLYNNPQSVFQVTGAETHGGTYAMKIVSVSMTTPIAGLPNPIGLAAPGQQVGVAPKFGFPYAARPNTMTFWAKYSPVSGDTAECAISIWNSTTHDTIATGVWKNAPTIGAYAQQTINLIYNPAFSSELPDSMGLTFSSTILFNPNYSICMNCGKVGSMLWVDDISFNGWNGIFEQLSSEGVSVFPNPAKDFLTIAVDGLDNVASVNVFDATGRRITSGLLSQSLNGMAKKSTVITTSDFSQGIYSFSVLDKNGNAVRIGKFSVVR